MNKKLIFSIFLGLTAAHEAWSIEPLSTIGSPTEGSTLYACSTTSIKNPNPTDGRDRIHTTTCRKVANPSTNPDPKNAHKYSPGAAMKEVDSAFFWYRQASETAGSDDLSSLCQSYVDHFKSCDWTKVRDDIKVDEKTMQKSETLVKDILKLSPSRDLTKSDVYGCAVVLCLANPNGWRSVGECHPPIHKLFRDLARGRGFPACRT